MQRPGLPKRGPACPSSTYLLSIIIAVTIALVCLGNYTLWLRRSCADREAAAAAGQGAMLTSTEALAAEVKRLQAQVLYLTAPSTASAAQGGASGGPMERIKHRAPGAAAAAPGEAAAPPPTPAEAAAAAAAAAAPLPPTSAALLAPLPRAAWRAPAGTALEPAPQQPSRAVAVLVICYNRASYLRRTLRAILARLPTYNRPHIYVSQDGSEADVRAAIGELRSEFAAAAPDIPFTHWEHPSAQPALRGGGPVPGWATSYYKLAQHFGWALGRLFEEAGHPHVIVLEDDLEVAVDFFDYMSAMAPLLDADATLLAASSYNDLGQEGLVRDARQVLRSDFFPGLGWMLNARAWKEDLGKKWPDSFWDDWLREPPQRRERQVLRPEVSRTVTFGENGVSQSQFFSAFLATVKLNEEPVDWAGEDLSYLQPAVWSKAFAGALAAARSAPSLEDFFAARCEGQGQGGSGVKHAYGTLEDYPKVAHRFSYIDDAKAGVPRTAYGGVVTFVHNGCRKFAIPG